MDLRLVFFDGCPNWKVADARLVEALEGTNVTVRHQSVRTVEEADRAGLRGSPTVLITGRDPFSHPKAPIALACRIYRTGSGPDQAPSVEDLKAALQHGP